MKRILVTGAGSYIGTAVERWLMKPEFAGMYQVDTVDMQEDLWKAKTFSGYDAVFHVAGIAHADVGKVTEEQKKLYYKVNCDLAVETAEKAKHEGVKQFIYMSSIIVYGEGTSVRKKRVITKNTQPSPSNFYGDSKWKAEQKLVVLETDAFNVAILRPPMIYGKGSKGNYMVLAKLARKVPIFPDIDNERSMLYIRNLVEFLRLLVDSGKGGTFFPQNAEYVKTSDMIELIGQVHGKRIKKMKCLNWTIFILSQFPGKVGGMANKAFGNLVYDKELSESLDLMGKYQLFGLKDSIQLTEESRMK